MFLLRSIYINRFWNPSYVIGTAFSKYNVVKAPKVKFQSTDK